MKKITLGELHHIVRIAANSCHVRYWTHWNYPDTSHRVMALQLVQCDHDAPGAPHWRPYQSAELGNKGWEWDEGAQVHLIERDCEKDGLDSHVMESMNRAAAAAGKD